MVSLDNAVVSRMNCGEDHLEILVDPHEAEQLMEGKEIDILSAHRQNFQRLKKGTHAPQDFLPKF